MNRRGLTSVSQQMLDSEAEAQQGEVILSGNIAGLPGMPCHNVLTVHAVALPARAVIALD